MSSSVRRAVVLFHVVAQQPASLPPGTTRDVQLTDSLDVAQVLDVVARDGGPANRGNYLSFVVQARQAPRKSMVLVDREGAYRTWNYKCAIRLIVRMKRRVDLPWTTVSIVASRWRRTIRTDLYIPAASSCSSTAVPSTVVSPSGETTSEATPARARSSGPPNVQQIREVSS